jgi:replicative DNA helicase
VSAGTKIVQLGYAADGGDVDEIVNAAQAEIYQVTERRATEDYMPLADIIEGTIDEIEASSSRGEGLTGVPTGFVDLDRLTNGLHPGQMVVIAARPAMGKALALDTPLPTPEGWTTMADVQPGDLLLGADGRPTRVMAVTEVMVGRPCYEVRFSDGSVIVADEQHLWVTQTRAERRADAAPARPATGASTTGPGSARTTGEIRATLRCRTADQRLNHSVRLTRPLDLPEATLLIPPYTLGAWLGDGTNAAAQITTADPEIVMQIEAEGLRLVPSRSARMRYTIRLPEESWRTSRVSVSPPTCPDCGGPCCGQGRCAACQEALGSVQARLRTLGVLGAKHIPGPYLRASERQRRALLAGLLDTDGTVTNVGAIQFTVTNHRLAQDVRELLSSLGYRSSVTRKQVCGRTADSSIAYSVNFTTDDQVFGLERKRLRHKELARRSFRRRDGRFITDVRPVASVPVRCVQVEGDDHLYLAGSTMIPTHNSTLALDIARSASIHHNLTSVIFSLEMGKNEITMRLLSAEARIPLQNMRKGTMREEDWTRLARTMGEVSDAPLFIDDSPNMSLMEIRAKCRRLKQRHDLKLVVIDYLQLMSSGKKVESRQQEVSEFSRALKLLAKELEVPVVALSQLNRGPEQRTDKKPQMSDLRESGSIEQDADVIILLHREDVYEKESPRAGEADFIVAKHRNGPTDTIVVAFQGHYSRFVDMAT